MKYFSIQAVFWLLVVSFFVILGQFFIPAIGELLEGSELFLIPFALFSLLGLALMVFTLRSEVKGRLRKLLILAGASALGFFVFVILHNLFYALAEVTSNITGLSYLMEVFHVAFFFIAIFGCPLGFLVGVAGSIVLFIKNNKKDIEIENERDK